MEFLFSSFFGALATSPVLEATEAGLWSTTASDDLAALGSSLALTDSMAAAGAGVAFLGSAAWKCYGASWITELFQSTR